MFKISRLADYGTVIMGLLAAQPIEQYSSAAAVSAKTHIKVPTVSKILKLLHEAGLLESLRGSNGGYRLTKQPHEISLAAVITAIDGKPAMTQCSLGKNICLHDHICEVRSHWRYINQAIINLLQQWSMADLGKPLQKMHKSENNYDA